MYPNITDPSSPDFCRRAYDIHCTNQSIYDAVWDQVNVSNFDGSPQRAAFENDAAVAGYPWAGIQNHPDCIRQNHTATLHGVMSDTDIGRLRARNHARVEEFKRNRSNRSI